ncbi:MAG: ABC transporter permease subunit, partial [Chloroflexota bacterium]|nr:ABC transporter permease subunit [Chloroflexota bacterium]
GRWKWPAVAFCTSIIAVSLVAPMSVLGYWVARGISAGEPFNLVWETIGNSIYVAALAATAAVIAAIPVAALTVRYPSLLSGFLEKLSYIGFALPGIAIALALVFFGARYALPLYQTTGLLLLAYVVLFISPALGALRTSMLQISPRLEEAARGLGKSPARALFTVTLPAVRPGLLAGWALVFLLVMKELPATLILSPIGFTTLATSIWSAASEAFFARAALPALLLIAASALPLTFLMLRERR